MSLRHDKTLKEAYFLVTLTAMHIIRKWIASYVDTKPKLSDWLWEIRMAFELSALGFYTDALNSYIETLEPSSQSTDVAECLASRRERWRYFKSAECRTWQTPHKRRPSSLTCIIFTRILFCHPPTIKWISSKGVNLSAKTHGLIMYYDK